MTSASVDVSRPPAGGLVRVGQRPPLRTYLRDLWTRRDFIATVARGQLRSQNQNTALGNVWHLLNPLFLAGVYYLIFGIIFQGRDSLEGNVSYAGFLITGIFVFTFTNKGMMSGARTVVSNLRLIQSVQFPRASLPLASIVAETIGQAFAFTALLGLVWITGSAPRPSWLLVVPAVLIMAAFNLGLAFMSARMTFHFRDTEQFLPYVLRIWMYMSGVFFPASYVAERGAPDVVLLLFKLDPLYVFMRIARDALLRGTFEPGYWGLALAWAAVVCTAGFLFFFARESEYGHG